MPISGTTGSRGVSANDFLRLLHEVDHSVPAAGPVDLLIRTGSERRLSDFLLWSAPTPNCIFRLPMAEFNEARFRQALAEYAGRQRRFGGLGAARIGSD